MTEVDNTARAAQSFSIGDVLATSFGVLGRNLIGFVAIAVLVQALVFVANRFLLLEWALPEVATGGFSIWPWLLSGLVALFAYAAVTAVISYGTYHDLRSDRASIVELVGRGVVVALPVLVVVILSSVGTSIGYALLIIPGIVLSVLWWVAIPAGVIERPGIFVLLGVRWRLQRVRDGRYSGCS